MLETLQNFQSQILDPDRFMMIAAAWLLCAIVGMVTGPMHGNANSFLCLITDATLGRLGARLDNKERKAGTLGFRGLMFTIFALFIALTFGQSTAKLVTGLPFGGMTEILLLSLCMTAGAVWYGLLRLYFALRENKPTPKRVSACVYKSRVGKSLSKGAYYTIARSTRTDLTASDDFGITRTGMLFAARSFDKGLVAPALWYLIGGLPAAFIYAVLSALAWRFGKDGFNKGFGNVALALEQLMGFVPTVFSGFIMACAGLLTPTGGMIRALVGLWEHKDMTPYAQGGLPVTALAFALGVSIGGPVTDIDGSSLKRNWVGPEGATAMLEKGHLRRGLYINLMAHLLFIAALFGALMWSRI